MFLLSAIIFIIGAVVGSFLNVVILRLPDAKKSIVFPGSHCFKCKRSVAAYDLIPILSWFFLRGKCRYCQASIAWRYPFIEFIIGAIALSLWLSLGFSWYALELFIFMTTLIAVTFIDIDTWLIPVQLPMFLIVTGLFFGYETDWASRVWGVILGFVFLATVLIVATWVLRRSKRLKKGELAMGWGDPWLLAGIGAYIGYLDLIYVVFFASVQGIIIFLLLGIKQNKAASDGWKPPADAIVFGPFLSLAGIEVVLFRDKVSVIGQQLANFFGN